MAYKVRIDNEPSWFEKSYTAMEKEVLAKIGDRLEIAQSWYEHEHNVKIIRAFGGDWGPFKYVQFKSKSDATMFMLRWA